MRRLCLVLILSACSGRAGKALVDAGAVDGGEMIPLDAASARDGAASDARPDGPPGVRSPDAAVGDASAAVGDASAAVGDASAALGGPSRCPGGFTVCESFETTVVGALPTGWAHREGYAGKSIGVSTDDAARGTHALKVEGGDSGSQFMERTTNLGDLATRHWGRIFFRVKVPAPWPSGGVLHGDIVQHLGPHPGGGTNGVRWGIVENTAMKFQWIYNVQPTQGEGEFADGTDYTYSWAGRWQCLEWRYDQPAQEGELWLDGERVPLTVGKSHAPEIPVFTSLGVGWANYQPAGAGFTVYIDEVAFHATRIGCAN